MAELEIGQTVELGNGAIATILWIGTDPIFASGDWVGVELEDGGGKNDGSVLGRRYFQCEMGKGMFVRPSTIAIIDRPAPPPKSACACKETWSTKKSMNAPSPSPMGRQPSGPSGLRSPTKSPTKQLYSAGTSVTSTPKTGTPANSRAPSAGVTRPRPSSVSRTSMGPPPPPGGRGKPLAGGSGLANRVGAPATRTAASRPTSLAPKRTLRPAPDRAPSGSSQVSTGHLSDGTHEMVDEEGLLSPSLRSDTDQLSPQASSPIFTRTGREASPAGSPAGQRIATSTAASREIEDLKTKLRVMEKKRMEDREKLKGLENVQAEKEKFEGIIQKLQTKYQPQQQELTDLRKQLKEFAARFEEVEGMQAEHESILEMATLDREMAEETAEVLRTELDALKQKTEELELEVEVLREENTELGGEMSAEEKTSQSYLQLERKNERLTEALLRLRDLTQQAEAELKDEIKSLQEDVRDLGSVKENYDAVKGKLAQSEAIIEDLRQQLDNALGAEDMIEELTDRNMSMSEQIEELKVTIEDLESLKELNDELEINHVETEKEMQEEIDFKESIINEQARRAAQQDETLDDMEYTLSRFRELVTSLQSDLEDIRASHAVTETESEQLNSRTRAMQDLNMKLQVSAAKTQVKTIDLELRRLDAQEASEHLSIVQLFLPDQFNTERDSVLALLRFRRVAFKANLLHGFVKERVNGQPPIGHEDDIFAGCDVLDKLVWVGAMCNRFFNAISHCSIEEFGKYEGALYELEPVERALNGWIDGLRRDELKEKQCASELQRTIALMSHLAEPAGKCCCCNFICENNGPNHHTSQEEDDELFEHFSKKTEAVITQTRSAKVIVGKAVREIEDMKARSLSLMPDTIESFEQCELATQQLADYTRHVGNDLFTVLHEEGRAEPYTYVEVQKLLNNQLINLSTLTSDLDKTLEFELATAPWILRSQELKSSKTVTVDTQEELRRLKEDNHERLRLIALRDQTLEESSVKIELLESRMRDATKKNERINELERKIEVAKNREAELAEAIELQNKELSTMEADREKWKKIADESKALGEVVSGSKAGQERAVATAREMDALKTEIASLQAAVRYLREDNRRVKLSERENMSWLDEPLIKSKSVEEQRKALVIAEGQDVLSELLTLATGENSRIYDLGAIKADRGKWRPAKSTPGYWVARQREEYEDWRTWKEEVVKKGRVLGEREGNVGRGVGTGRKGLKKDGERNVAAKVDLRWKDLEGKGAGRGREVEIVGAGDWEGVRREWGFV
ncbi:CAP-Gly domain-containing protein [Botrytis cinerea]